MGLKQQQHMDTLLTGAAPTAITVSANNMSDAGKLDAMLDRQYLSAVLGTKIIGVSSTWILADHGQVAVHRRKEDGFWDLGAGKLEFDDDFDSALWRELYEELTLTPQQVMIRHTLGPDFIEFELGGVRRRWLNRMYALWMTAPREEAILRELDKHEDLRWVNFGDWPGPLHPASLQRIKVFGLGCLIE